MGRDDKFGHNVPKKPAKKKGERGQNVPIRPKSDSKKG